jgi:hypothetical protein
MLTLQLFGFRLTLTLPAPKTVASKPSQATTEPVSALPLSSGTQPLKEAKSEGFQQFLDSLR